MGSYINRENLWSDSLTKDILTVYAEGLACYRFDKRKCYNVRRHAKATWYFLLKSIGEVGEPSSTHQLIFNQVGSISINHYVYIPCSYDGVQRYLIACRHSWAVLTNKKHYEPSIFHIRWHTL